MFAYDIIKKMSVKLNFNLKKCEGFVVFVLTFLYEKNKIPFENKK